MSEFDGLFDKNRDKLNSQFANKHKKMLELSRYFQDSISKYRDLGWNAHAEIWNAAFYLNMAAHDVSVLVLQLATEREEWTRKLVARHLALVAYESAEDMTQLLGKPIRDPLQKLGILDALDQHLRETRRPLDSYWNQYASTLKILRIAAAAHREHNGIVLFETIDKIDIEHILELGLRLGNVQNQLGTNLQFILNRIATIRPPEIVVTA